MSNSLEKHLEFFKINYKKKAISGNYELMYLFPTHNLAARETTNANYLINKLKLPLVAILYNSCNYFVVKSEEVEL
jgi:hypothetical protein